MSKKQKDYGNCALCNKYSELEESHIVPKFFIKQAGLTQESFSIICSSDPSSSEPNRQDGIKEPLLCGECEDRLEKWETYASLMLYGSGNPFEAIAGNGVEWHGLKYAEMKLCFSSILWRMSVSKHGFYSTVDLGQKHEAILRDMMLKQNPGETWQYGCMLGYLFLNGKPLPDGVFSQPKPIRAEDGRIAYRFLMANFYVLIDASSHAPSLEATRGYLQLDGSWGVPIIESTNIEFIRNEMALQRRNAHLYKHNRKKVIKP